MNILHFILGKANPNRANGVNQVVYGLAKTQTELGHNVKVIGLSQSTDKNFEVINRGNFNVEVFKRFSGKCEKRLHELIQNSDIIHLHGVWNFYNIKVGKYCKKIKKPYVVTAHGGYVKQNVKNSSYIQKLLYHVFWQKKLYERASFVQALTREESSDILYYCKNANTITIPNAIEPDLKSVYTIKKRSKLKFGYIGRISKEKNLENLITAFSKLPQSILSTVELQIIGPKSKYCETLKKLATELNISNQIHFVGPKYNNDKVAALLDLDIYIHPSLMEGFSIAILEVLSLGIPAIITRTSNMAYYYNSNSFIMAEPTATDMARAIEEIIKRKDEWSHLSLNGRKLIQNKLTWEIVTKQMCDEYQKYIK